MRLDEIRSLLRSMPAGAPVAPGAGAPNAAPQGRSIEMPNRVKHYVVKKMKLLIITTPLKIFVWQNNKDTKVVAYPCYSPYHGIEGSTILTNILEGDDSPISFEQRTKSVQLAQSVPFRLFYHVC